MKNSFLINKKRVGKNKEYYNLKKYNNLKLIGIKLMFVVLFLFYLNLLMVFSEDYNDYGDDSFTYYYSRNPTIQIGFPNEDYQVTIEDIKLYNSNNKLLNIGFNIKDLGNNVFMLQPLSSLNEENYTLKIKAKDLAGNEYTSKLDFGIEIYGLEINLLEPRFGYITKSRFNLTINTSKETKCYFSLDGYYFNSMKAKDNSNKIFYKTIETQLNEFIIYTKCYDSDYESNISQNFIIKKSTEKPKIIELNAQPRYISRKINDKYQTNLSLKVNIPSKCYYNISKLDIKIKPDSKGNYNLDYFKPFDDVYSQNKNKIIDEFSFNNNYNISVVCLGANNIFSDLKKIQVYVKNPDKPDFVLLKPDKLMTNKTTLYFKIETNGIAKCSYNYKKQDSDLLKSGDFSGEYNIHDTTVNFNDVGKYLFNITCLFATESSLNKISKEYNLIISNEKPNCDLYVYNSNGYKVIFNLSCANSDYLDEVYYTIGNSTYPNDGFNSIIKEFYDSEGWLSDSYNEQIVFTDSDPNELIKGFKNGTYYLTAKVKNDFGIFSDVYSKPFEVKIKNLLSHCFNKVRDFDETDKDCGGSCSPCLFGKNCSETKDCATGLLCMNHKCVSIDDECNDDKDCSDDEYCDDGICKSKETKKQCESDYDCDTNELCINGICTKNANNCESDDDCNNGEYCDNGVCKPNENLNYPSYCYNNKRDEDYGETDVDCGGNCKPCNINETCLSDIDCNNKTNLICVDVGKYENMFGICKPNYKILCNNSKEDDNETDVDCGGVCVKYGKTCDLDEKCKNDSDCKSNFCDAGVCTDQSKKDSDGDGIPDVWEKEHGLNPTKNDANDDFDEDGLSNYKEYKYKTDPMKKDSDDDGFTDYNEIQQNTDPLDPESHPSSFNFLWILLIILFLGIIGGLLYVLTQQKPKKKEKENKSTLNKFDFETTKPIPVKKITKTTQKKPKYNLEKIRNERKRKQRKIIFDQFLNMPNAKKQEELSIKQNNKTEENNSSDNKNKEGNNNKYKSYINNLKSKELDNKNLEFKLKALSEGKKIKYKEKEDSIKELNNLVQNKEVKMINEIKDPIQELDEINNKLENKNIKETGYHKRDSIDELNEIINNKNSAKKDTDNYINSKDYIRSKNIIKDNIISDSENNSDDPLNVLNNMIENKNSLDKNNNLNGFNINIDKLNKNEEFNYDFNNSFDNSDVFNQLKLLIENKKINFDDNIERKLRSIYNDDELIKKLKRISKS